MKTTIFGWLLIGLALWGSLPVEAQNSSPQSLKTPVYFFENYFLDLLTLSKKETIIGKVHHYFQDEDRVYLLRDKNLIDVYYKLLGKKLPYSLPSINWPTIRMLDGYLLITDSKTGQSYLYSPIRKQVFRGKIPLDAAIYQSQLFLETPKNGLDKIDLKSGKRISLPNPEAGIEKNINGRNLLFSCEDGVIYIKDLESRTGLVIYKYDETGRVLFKVQTDHTEIDIKGNTHYHHRYLRFYQKTRTQLFFSTNVFARRRVQKTKMIDLKTGQIKVFPFIIHGLVSNEAGEPIGLLSHREKTHALSLFSLEGKKQWEYLLGKQISQSLSRAAAILVGETLILGLYHEISTGSGLLALDFKTGKLRWQGLVKQAKVGHSEYYTTVYLNRFRGYVLMLGVESSATYLQIFKITTGKRVYCDLRLK